MLKVKDLRTESQTAVAVTKSVCSFVRRCLRSFVRRCLRSFVRLCVRSLSLFVCLLLPSFVVVAFVPSFVVFVPSFVRASICRFLCLPSLTSFVAVAFVCGRCLRTLSFFHAFVVGIFRSFVVAVVDIMLSLLVVVVVGCHCDERMPCMSP